MNYQWYPGHMTKAKRMMQEDIKLIDLVIELVDARVPLSSRNPDIDELGKNKARLILLNKADLASDECNALWMAYFKTKGYFTVKVNSRNGSGIKAVEGAKQEAQGDKKPSCAGDGCRYTKCGKIYVHQYFCRESLCENR